MFNRIFIICNKKVKLTPRTLKVSICAPKYSIECNKTKLQIQHTKINVIYLI